MVAGAVNQVMGESHSKPDSLPSFLRWQGDALVLAVKLQPRASRNEILGAQGGELRVRVTAPPVDSAANEALVRLLAERLVCSRSCVELVRGQTSRHKVVKLRGMTPAVVLERFGRKG
jgi:uncharacterized protein (TIGR00251 family)